MITPQLHYYPMGLGVKAFSSTRQGGYSEGRYEAFNINRYCGDNEEAIRKNRDALCRELGIEEHHLLMPHQVHERKTVVIDEAFLKLSDSQREDRLEGVDALMTSVTGVCIGVSTADCIPVLLYDHKHHAICAIHAGWRGTVRRIVEQSVKIMQKTYGTHPSDLLAQIGPGISLDSFEVGDEVYEAFIEEGFAMDTISRRYPTADTHLEKWHIDLPMCNRLQLMQMGVPANQIAVSSICTYKNADTYFSARRLGIHSGRIFTGIMLTV